MKGQFTAVVHGEFESRSSVRPALVAVLLGAAALVSYLLTVLVDLAIAFGAFAAVLLGACCLLRRRPDRDSELLAERISALQAEASSPRPVSREVHYHLYLPPGADASGVSWAALPPGNAITEEN